MSEPYTKYTPFINCQELSELADADNTAEVFRFVFEYGRDWRRANPNGDGREAWGVPKAILEPLPHTYKWMHFDMFEPFSKHADGKDVPHYLYQLWNLPHNTGATICRVAQVAFNLGQFVGSVPEHEWANWGFTPELLNLNNYITCSM
jgi:hypothetical protein